MAERTHAMPNRLRQRIMWHWAKGDRPLVVTGRGNKPTKVYGYEEYQKMVRHPKKHKPWEHRKGKRTPDPLGAVKGTVLGPLTRDRMYEE